MGNVLEKTKQEQVIALGRLGWSLRRIEGATGVRRETAGGYLRSAGIALRTPGGWGRKAPVAAGSASSKPAIEVITGSSGSRAADNSKPANEVITGFLPEVTLQEQGSKRPSGASEPYREMIELELSRGRNAMGIWQDLVDKHGFRSSYQSVQRFVLKLRGAVSAEARVIIETKLGEEAQVDYGTGPMVRDPDSGKYRRTRLFVLTLGCSRKSVRLLVFRSSARVWAELHEKAFRRLGGSPRIVVLDNLREGVLSPDFYDPGLNPLYRDVLGHYGVTALPCKVRDPDRKGKVESGVAHAQKTPLRGKKFESLEEAQAYLDHWEERWADKRIHGRTKRQVAAMFAEEKPHLQPLPLEPFRYYQYGERTVHIDGCVEVEAAYYGAPPGWIGRKVNVQWDAMFVRLLDPRSGELLREHLSGKRGGHRIRDADRPRRTPPPLLQLLARAHKAGANIGAVCDAKRLDNFDFQFNVRMNRNLVFELATANWVGKREDALFLGPPGSGKSHCAQAIGHAVIQQGYRVLYREAHRLLEELADAALDGKRKEFMDLLTTVPLLIIDDLGMRKLPLTAAEELLEIIMRRYERASTLLTSNRPVDDWGKLLGDSAAVTAMLDRLLHHGHVLKCGPRSWRTKTGTSGEGQ
jgi:DNA replication protein DnaC/transposase